MKRKILGIFFLIIAVVLSSCFLVGTSVKNNSSMVKDTYDTDADEINDTEPIKGGTLRLFSTFVDVLNPILTKNVYINEYLGFVFEGMVKINKDQVAIPDLADKWYILEDNLTWVFHLKDDVLWHDNTPFTSEDVVFTIETILNSNIDSIYKKNLENIAAFSAVDSHSVKISLKKPNSFTAHLMAFPIMPKHHYAGEDFYKSSKNMSPMGTGPYRFESYEENKALRLRANDSWHNKTLVITTDKYEVSTPYIVEIEIKLYDSDGKGEGLLKIGEIDVLNLESESMGDFIERTYYNRKKYIGRYYDFLAFNTNRWQLNENLIRKAISYAIDKDALVSEEGNRYLVAADIPLIPDTHFYSTNIVEHSCDLKKAKDLLKEAGFEESGESMTRLGNPLSLDLIVNRDNELRVKMAEKISEQLERIGIVVELKKISWNDEQRRLKNGSFDMCVIGCKIPSEPDMSFLYTTENIVGGMNISKFSDPKLDEVFLKISKEIDENEQKALFNDVRNIINLEVPYAGLYFYNNMMVYSKKIRGIKEPSIWNRYNDITKWYIPVKIPN